uniref:Uncharacterized protein n=1 Tax=Noctiluca scintillans TaxID=2966 RepID=A0A7S1AEJ2_NOCSC|mmetsp:Transcript_42974/g.113228  ORF Transcript_42974/g.113228 Transcript_42974/m.113228 type:complete len:665 (+) Transcript_42974:72-2066(+)
MWKVALLVPVVARRTIVEDDDDSRLTVFGCAHDIIVESPHGTSRVLSEIYRESSVPLFNKYTELPNMMCASDYSVGCDDFGRVVLHKQEACGGTQTSAVERLITSPGSRRVSIRPNHRETRISFSDLLNLPRMLSGTVLLKVSDKKCSSAAPDSCYEGCCPDGKHCQLTGEQGECVTREFEAEKVCALSDTTSVAACWHLVSDVGCHTNEWALMVPLLHVGATRDLGERFEKRVETDILADVGSLERGSNLLSEKWFKLLNASILQGRRSVEQLDVVSSPCGGLFEFHRRLVDRTKALQWNSEHREASMAEITNMAASVSQQWMTKPVSARGCTNFMLRVLDGRHHGKDFGPTVIIATDPFFLFALEEALRQMDDQDADDTKLIIQLHMTDLPSPAAVNFFAPLKAYAGQAVASRVRVHSVAPVTGGSDAIARHAGLSPSQVVIEQYMPVRDVFIGDVLPRPGSDTRIVLQTPRGSLALNISARDNVTLINVGEFPEVSVVQAYGAAVQRLKAEFSALQSDGKHWIFLNCGDTTQPRYAQVYEQLVAGNADHDRLIFVPFRHQSVDALVGRSTTSVLLPHGLRCGEHLALAQRGDHRKLLIHARVPPGVSREPPKGTNGRISWEESLLDEGMVPWEAGNVRHLMSTVEASVVTPESLSFFLVGL